MTYSMTFTDKEFRLITLALADRIEDDEDSEEALKLNTKLCHQRYIMINQAREQAEKALENASALENPSIPPYKK